MIFKNLHKKKDFPVYFFISFIFLYNIRDIIFPKNFQQDDIAELYI